MLFTRFYYCFHTFINLILHQLSTINNVFNKHFFFLQKILVYLWITTFFMTNTKDKKVLLMLRIARIRKRLSQEQLANRLSVSQSYISKLENKRTKTVSIELVLKLSKILSICPISVFVFLADGCCPNCNLNCRYSLKNK